MPVNEEPARQRQYPRVPPMPCRHRRCRDQEGNVRQYVQVRHPVRAQHGRVHGREGQHGREAGGRTLQRSRPAVTHACDQPHEQGVQRVHREQLAVPRRRDHVQPRPEQGFPGRHDVHVRGPWMVEMIPGVVPDQQREVPCLLHQDGVGAHVRVLVQARAEQEPVADAQQHDQRHRRHRRYRPRTNPALLLRSAAGPGQLGRGGRFALPADTHLALSLRLLSKYLFQTSTVWDLV